MASVVFIHLLNNISTSRKDIFARKKWEFNFEVLGRNSEIGLFLPFMLILRLNHPKVFI